MIKGGKGGGNTITGLKFEKRIHLETAINKIKGLIVKDCIVYKNKKAVAYLYSKNSLYKNLLDPKGLNYLNYISKKLLPDEAILVNDVLYIIEMKFQYVEGSVDEKLQTCHFKLNQYKRLMAPLGIKVEYVYVLNDWFRKPAYRDVLVYVEEMGCHYFFNEIPLSLIGF